MCCRLDLPSDPDVTAARTPARTKGGFVGWTVAGCLAHVTAMT
ncbi:MAG: hypothetical protein Q7S93_16010 [Phenylobacterium sp.]|nr:hypothetical protein [Phenylobacterium sp.]MDO8411559.1 hypothetical protein [Phenylobacterium sp.]